MSHCETRSNQAMRRLTDDELVSIISQTAHSRRSLRTEKARLQHGAFCSHRLLAFVPLGLALTLPRLTPGPFPGAIVDTPRICPECWTWYDSAKGPCPCLDDAPEPEPRDPGPMDDLPDCEPDQIDR